MIHASLFSGIGGFDLASKWVGWENAFTCEKDEFCQTVLKYYFKECEHYGDITNVDFRQWRGKIDVLSGGFPCQPFSDAGKKAGKSDDRYLWPEMLRAIREIEPVFIVGENVRGIINQDNGGVFESVCRDLEDEGYEIQPFLLPACSIGAPHERYRVFFVAHSKNARLSRSTRSNEWKKYFKNNRERIRSTFVPTFKGGVAYNTKSSRRKGQLLKRSRQRKPRGLYSKKHASNSTNPRFKNLQRKRSISSNRFNKTTYANSSKRSKGRLHEKGQKKTKRYVSAFNTRTIGGAWKNFPTQPPICSGNDGLSSRLDRITVSTKHRTRTLTPKQTYNKIRSESIKGYGNAVVPQLVFEIFKSIDNFINQK